MNQPGRATRRRRLVVAGFCSAAFALSLVALVAAQLSLMSVLDTTRAEHAAEQIAESRFTAELIEGTVTRAIAPAVGPDLARQAADAASEDARVVGVVADVLVTAHRHVVDPDAPAATEDGNLLVGSAIITSLLDGAAAAGIDPALLGLAEGLAAGETVDPTAVARTMPLPDGVPEDLPRLGLRQVAETTRTIALVAADAYAVAAVAVHPRPGRAVRDLGITVAIVTGVWLLALLVAGWVIDLVSSTLFGEMLDAVWSDAVPSMLLLVTAGVVIGAGLVFAGLALEGYRSRPSATPRT